MTKSIPNKPYDILNDKNYFDNKNGTKYYEKSDRSYFLSKVGEYAAVAKLLRSGINCFLTNGNKRGCDIVATGNIKKSVDIEVKTSNSKRIVTNFFQKYGDETVSHPDFWILVYSYAEKNGIYDVYKERYFILTHEELRDAQFEYNNKYVKKSKGISLTIEEFAKDQYEKRKAGEKKAGVDNINIDEISKYEDAWDKIYIAVNKKVDTK